MTALINSLRGITTFACILTILIGGVSCSSSSTSSESENTQTGISEPNDTQPDPTLHQVNKEKLVGTPFEGLETADNIPSYYFLTRQYLSAGVESLPIPIFTAFFTRAEDQLIQSYIQTINEKIGVDLFAYTDTWTDKARVMYKANGYYSRWAGASGTEWRDKWGGQTFALTCYPGNGTVKARPLVTDWAVIVKPGQLYLDLVAHELGHAMGLMHYLIDPETGSISEKRWAADAIMQSSSGQDFSEYVVYMKEQHTLLDEFLGIELGNESNPRDMNANCWSYEEYEENYPENLIDALPATPRLEE